MYAVKKHICISPGLSSTGSVGALIKAIEALNKLCSKLNVQEICLSTAEHPGRENAYLLMRRVVKNWKNLEQEKIVGSTVCRWEKKKDLDSQLPYQTGERGSGLK